MPRIRHKTVGRHQEREVRQFVLQSGENQAMLLNYGALLKSFRVKNPAGESFDIVLGYDSLEEYLSDPHFFGAMIGPMADRLSAGRCILDGQEVQLPLNAGRDSMHSGPGGFHSRVWEWSLLRDGVCFHREFMRGELGFPARIRASLSYRMTAPETLRLEYVAFSDGEMAFSLTNHSYFNLDGARRNCLDHSLWVFSESYAQADQGPDPLVSGCFCSVRDTPLDLRHGRRVGDLLQGEPHPEIAAAGGLDHFFPIAGEGFRDAARIESQESGLALLCQTDAEGVLVYTGNGLSETRGKAGSVYGRHWGICLETEQLPNAVNLPGHRERVLFRAGEEYRSVTEFTVSTPGQAHRRG